MRITVFLLSLFLASFSYAEQAEQADWLDDANKQLASWQKELTRWHKAPPSQDELVQRQDAVNTLRQKATTCVEGAKQQLDDLALKITTLGEQQVDEAEKVKKFRTALSQEKKAIEDRSALCRVANLAARNLIGSLKTLRSEVVSRALTQREPGIWQKTLEVANTTTWLKIPFTDFKFWPAWLIALISLVTLYPLASFSAHLLRRCCAQSTSPKPTARLPTMLANRLPWIAVLASLALFAYFGENTLLTALPLALSLSLLIAPLIETYLCKQAEKCTNGLPARILIDLLLVGILSYWIGIGDILQPLVLDVVYGFYLLLVLLTAIWLTVATLQQQTASLLRNFSLPLVIALSAGPIAFWLGYRALAEMLILGIYGSLAGLIAILAVYHLFSAFLNYLDSPASPVGKNLRAWLGYKDEEKTSSFGLIRFLWAVSMLGLFVYWLLLAWKVPTADVGTLVGYFTEGFQVGATTIVPGNIIGALVALFVLFNLARWLRKQLGEHWLKKTSLDAGAQQSIVALSSYTITGLSILLALNMSGIELQSLAIVAGALSVGIGFGLQNIVNNFVSGLILLFERPVKPGDWVVIGETEGYIKKINIRYTQIKTFDRSDVLVPNSELISSPMTNWMLHDRLGRLVVKIGVAYGTDTRKVSDILVKIAKAQPLVLTNGARAPAPRVFFMNFGNSSLDFELRCFVKDVDSRMSVHSDILFAIDDAFRKENIEIPFPQQVVHLADEVKLAANSQ